MTDYPLNNGCPTEKQLDEFFARALKKSKQYKKEKEVENEKLIKVKDDLEKISGKSAEEIEKLVTEFKTELNDFENN